MNAKKQSTRDQLKDLLINKFRNKYNISMTKDNDLDQIIIREVSKLLN